jgi:hypothetical protein
VKFKTLLWMAGALAAAGVMAPLLEAPPGAGEQDDGETPAAVISFSGPKADPKICVTKGDERRCCGHTKKAQCRGSDVLHPSMKRLAACLGQALHLGGPPETCPGGIGESFRGLSLQESYTSLKPGWSLHNYGLAFDACCYYKSNDCSEDNLINKVVGGIKIWKKNGATRCQAIVKMDKSVKSKEASKMVLGSKAFGDTLPLVEACYSEAGLTFGEWSWGVGWEDYFDAPHFQYFPSERAGYYTKKSERKNGAHIMVRIYEDCFSGNRKAMLEELYASETPEQFLAAHKDGCGEKAFSFYEDLMKNIKK